MHRQVLDVGVWFINKRVLCVCVCWGGNYCIENRQKPVKQQSSYACSKQNMSLLNSRTETLKVGFQSWAGHPFWNWLNHILCAKWGTFLSVGILHFLPTCAIHSRTTAVKKRRKNTQEKKTHKLAWTEQDWNVSTTFIFLHSLQSSHCSQDWNVSTTFIFIHSLQSNHCSQDWNVSTTFIFIHSLQSNHCSQRCETAVPSTTVYNVTRMHAHMQARTHCDMRKHTYSHVCIHAQHARMHTTCMQSCTYPQVGTETCMHINTHVRMQACPHGDPQTQLFFGAAAKGVGGP